MCTWEKETWLLAPAALATVECGPAVVLRVGQVHRPSRLITVRSARFSHCFDLRMTRKTFESVQMRRRLLQRTHFSGANERPSVRELGSVVGSVPEPNGKDLVTSAPFETYHIGIPGQGNRDGEVLEACSSTAVLQG